MYDKGSVVQWGLRGILDRITQVKCSKEPLSQRNQVKACPRIEHLFKG